MHFVFPFSLIASVSLRCSHGDPVLTSEFAVPVVLWDSEGNPVKSGGKPARYTIGTLSIGGRPQHFTFDAGNARQPILLAEGCKGCSSGCPHTVPECSTSSSTCWPSHPEDYAPSGSYETVSGGCPEGVRNAGKLDGVAVCTQCFGGGHTGHARFFTMANAKVVFGNSADNITVMKPAWAGTLRFGALVRTTPEIDRVWSNVGVGYRSAFLQQIGASSVMFHLRAGGESKVIFNPSRDRYVDAPKAPFKVDGNRIHTVDKIQIGNATVKMSSTTFHMDTGNDGISIATDSDLSAILAAADGFTRQNAPDIIVFINGMGVTLPGSTWMPYLGGKTVFFSPYHKNVLGLPFWSVADIVFDDEAEMVYIGGASPAPPAPPAPPTPPPSNCMQACIGQRNCDCKCFCSCGGVCGNGCYDKCRSVHNSCHSCQNLVVV